MKKKKINNRINNKREEQNSKHEISRNTEIKEVSLVKKSVALCLIFLFVSMSIFAPVIV